MVAEQRKDPSEAESPAVPVSSELFAPGAPGVELCYQTFGSPDDDPLLLVMGLGGPMTWWDPVLCRMLAERIQQVFADVRVFIIKMRQKLR